MKCPKASLTFSTNGILTDSIVSKMEEIRRVNPRVSVSVSIDDFQPSDAILRGSLTHFQNAWATAKELKDRNFNVGIGSVVTDLNFVELPAFHSLCSSRGFYYGIALPMSSVHYYNSDGHSMLHAPSKDVAGLIKQIRGDSTFSRLQAKALTSPNLVPCFSCFSSFFLSSVGNVYPCIMRNDQLGNLTQRPLEEIWRSAATKNMRRSIVKGECSCFNYCEVKSSLDANIFPSIMARTESYKVILITFNSTRLNRYWCSEGRKVW